MKNCFYNQYFKLPQFDLENKAYSYKNDYIRSRIDNGKYIYKFFSFDNNSPLNISKIKTFEDEAIWCSPFFCFDDKREFYYKYNLSKVTEITNFNLEYVTKTLNMITQLTDLSSFTYYECDTMWKNYANYYNGFCVVYEVINTDYFYPIVYENKD